MKELIQNGIQYIEALPDVKYGFMGAILLLLSLSIFFGGILKNPDKISLLSLIPIVPGCMLLYHYANLL